MANLYTIQELVAFARGTDQELKNNEFEFGIFPNGLAQNIAGTTGVNIIGAVRYIKPFGIAHAIQWHGSNEEFERNQIPVYDQDFDLVPQVVHEYDHCERARDNRRGDKSLYFHKSIGTTRFTACMTLTQNRDGSVKKLTLATMFKKPV